MDPDACVARIYRALADTDIDEAGEAVANLKEWLDRGGFPPDETNVRKLAVELGCDPGDLDGVLRRVEAMRVQGVSRGA